MWIKKTSKENVKKKLKASSTLNYAVENKKGNETEGSDMQLLNVQLFFRIIDSFRENDNGIVCDGLWGFPCGSAGKESSCNVEDLGSVSGLGRSPGGGNG